ncbi:MAG: iron ABC transporter permease [Planctomycetaceae bacterium]|nr:iron ABC transporter permease [Planctomycetaceae bacterium]
MYRIFLAVLIFCVLVGVFFLPVVGRTFYFPDIFSSSPIYILRFNRTIIAMLAGGGLAIGGLVFQSLFRNPLATPYTLGVASGASFGAAVSFQVTIYFGVVLSGNGVFAFLGYFGLSMVSIGAFVGALLSTLVVFALARGKDASSEQMLLAGVAVNFFFASLIVLMQYISAPHDALQILHWTMGELQNAVIGDIWRIFPFVVILLLVLMFFSRELNVIVMGVERAKSLGIDVGKLRIFLFMSVSIMIGAIVAVTGPIGFIGLMVPHIFRLVVGVNHRRLIPVTLLGGAIFLAICDTISRTIFYPTQLPVGITTNLIGGPFFLWLLLKSERRLV